MAEESENIEARLAAYIDGDLPPQERIDIEQYLAANPSHANLIASLRQQHAQLSGLPREKSPAEVMDHIQQHLERHALLSDADDGATLRPSRWPQWTAIAAMLMLAAGLGLLVYQVLPGGGRGEHLAIEQNLMNSLSKLPASEPSVTDDLESPAGGQSPAMTADQKALSATLPSDVSVAAAAPQKATADGMAPMRTRQQQGESGAAGFGEVADKPVAASRDFVEEMADRMTKDQARRAALAKSDAARHATLTIASPDPAMSSALVAEYLVQNGLTFDTLPAVPAAPAAMTEPATTGPSSPSAPMIKPGATLVLHGISAEHAKAMLIAISDLQAGKQQVTLQPLPPLPLAATQPATIEADALAMKNEVDSPATQNAPALAAGSPAVPATTQPAESTPAQPKASPEESGELWVIITAAAPVPTTAPAASPPAGKVSLLPTTEPAKVPPATVSPTTSPFEQP